MHRWSPDRSTRAIRLSPVAGLHDHMPATLSPRPCPRKRYKFALGVAEQAARQATLVTGHEHDHAVAAAGRSSRGSSAYGDLFGRTLHGKQPGDELLVDQPPQPFLAAKQTRGDLQADPRAVAVGDGNACSAAGRSHGGGRSADQRRAAEGSRRGSRPFRCPQTARRA